MQRWEEDITKLLLKLSSRKEAEFFREPVDWEGLGLTDYPTIITNPMDLRTAKEKLENGQYETSLEAAADIRLIFLNAMTYNAPGSRVYVYAKTLSDSSTFSNKRMILTGLQCWKKWHIGLISVTGTYAIMYNVVEYMKYSCYLIFLTESMHKT